MFTTFGIALAVARAENEHDISRKDYGDGGTVPGGGRDTGGSNGCEGEAHGQGRQRCRPEGWCGVRADLPRRAARGAAAPGAGRVGSVLTNVADRKGTGPDYRLVADDDDSAKGLTKDLAKHVGH